MDEESSLTSTSATSSHSVLAWPRAACRGHLSGAGAAFNRRPRDWIGTLASGALMLCLVPFATLNPAPPFPGTGLETDRRKFHTKSASEPRSNIQNDRLRDTIVYIFRNPQVLGL